MSPNKLIAALLLICTTASSAAPIDQFATPVPGQHAAPQYPTASRVLNQEGTVVVSLTIATDGTGLNSRVGHSSGYPRLDQAVLDAVTVWR